MNLNPKFALRDKPTYNKLHHLTHKWDFKNGISIPLLTQSKYSATQKTASKSAQRNYVEEFSLFDKTQHVQLMNISATQNRQVNHLVNNLLDNSDELSEENRMQVQKYLMKKQFKSLQSRTIKKKKVDCATYDEEELFKLFDPIHKENEVQNGTKSVNQTKALSNLCKATENPIQLFSDKYPKKSGIPWQALYNERINEKKRKNSLYYPPVEKNTYKMAIPNSSIIQEKLIDKISPKKLSEDPDLFSLYKDKFIQLKQKDNNNNTTLKQSRLVQSVNEYNEYKNDPKYQISVDNTKYYEPANVFDILTDPKQYSYQQGVSKFYDGWYLNCSQKLAKLNRWKKRTQMIQYGKDFKIKLFSQK